MSEYSTHQLPVELLQQIQSIREDDPGSAMSRGYGGVGVDMDLGMEQFTIWDADSRTLELDFDRGK